MLAANFSIDIPADIYTDDKACGEFIVSLNERLSQVSIIEKALRAAKDEASNVMLERLSLTGQKHFAFDFGTFAKTTKTRVSFPTAENGGREAAVRWVEELLERGLIDMTDVLNIQQARISDDTLLAIEEQVKEYNLSLIHI